MEHERPQGFAPRPEVLPHSGIDHIQQGASSEASTAAGDSLLG